MMKMKKEIIKKICIVFLILLVPAVFLTGCQNKEVSKNSIEKQQITQTQQIAKEQPTNNEQIETTKQNTENKEIKNNNTTNEDQELIKLLNELENE